MSNQRRNYEGLITHFAFSISALMFQASFLNDATYSFLPRSRNLSNFIHDNSVKCNLNYLFTFTK